MIIKSFHKVMHYSGKAELNINIEIAIRTIAGRNEIYQKSLINKTRYMILI
jgi:hypothetical protein